MKTEANIKFIGDKIPVDKLIKNINEFMKELVELGTPVDMWEITVKGG